ncbi:MAG TPA: 1-deoxy-D-xylulose-5-phosphate reductoisomerase, partial [Gemmatimonadetes bacterium]|nr:1-deoxy-D-xylulose-5-phosphate reductoisomerase [Gemmatimonadota bacterium]
EAFLEDRIRFPEMPEVVERTMDRIGIAAPRDLTDVISVDRAARKVSAEEVARCAQSIGKKS